MQTTLNKQMKGKTVLKVINKAINYWQFTFTDGTVLDLRADNHGPLDISAMYLEKNGKFVAGLKP